MTASPPRLDANSPLLREIRTSADRGFTGSITARSGASEVSVYLADGHVYAAHSPQLALPFGRHLDTGEGEESAAAGLDARQRDWAYGLIAAAVTWQRAKVSRARKKSTENDTFAPTAWQVILADVSARVDDVVTAWAAIVEALAAEGIAKRAASTACSRLIVTVPGHQLLTGDSTIDQTARENELTRVGVLRQIAALILAGEGEQLRFAIAPDPIDGSNHPVPESLEDPAAEWGSVDHLYIEPAPAPMLAIEAAHPQVEEDAPSTDQYSESEHQQHMDYYDTPSGPDEPIAGPEESDPLRQATPQPERLDATDHGVPAQEPAEVHHEVTQFDPEHAARMSGADALRTWIGGAEDTGDRDLREHIYVETIHTTARVAREKLQDLEGKVQGYERTLESLPKASEMVQATRLDLEEAKRQAAQIEAHIAQLLEQEEELIDAAERAKSFAAAAARSVQEARHAVEAVKLELARREQAESESAVAEADAIDRARKAVTSVNDLRTGAMAEASHRRDVDSQDVLGPAQRSYEAAKSVADDAHRDVLTARQAAQLAGREATQSVRIVAELDDRDLCDVTGLVTQLQHLHGRASQEVDGLSEEIEVPVAEASTEAHLLATAPEPELAAAEPQSEERSDYTAPALQTHEDYLDAGQHYPEAAAEQVPVWVEHSQEPDPMPSAGEWNEPVPATPEFGTSASDLDGQEELSNVESIRPEAPSFAQIIDGAENDDQDGAAGGATWRPIRGAA